MRFKFLLSFLLFFGAITLSHASFPVKRTVATTSTTTNISPSSDVSVDAGSDEFYSPAAKAGDDKLVGILLWVFLWPFAAHRWYYGKPIGWNILFILTFGGLGIWAIVDLVNMITDNF